MGRILFRTIVVHESGLACERRRRGGDLPSRVSTCYTRIVPSTQHNRQSQIIYPHRIREVAYQRTDQVESFCDSPSIGDLFSGPFTGSPVERFSSVDNMVERSDDFFHGCVVVGPVSINQVDITLQTSADIAVRKPETRNTYARLVPFPIGRDWHRLPQ